MADHRRQPNSTESGASTGASDSMLWAPALLAAGDQGSTSSFRLPTADPSLSSNAPTGGAQTLSQEDLQMLPYEDLGVYMRERHPVEKLLWSDTCDVNIPLTPLPFEANSRPPATLPHQPRTEAPPFQPAVPASYTTQMPVAASSASFASQFASPGVATPPRHPLHASQFASLGVVTPTRPPRYSTLDRTRPKFRVRMCPSEDSTTRNSLVPHAPEVTMPTIGKVAGFRRTSNSFLELPAAPPAAPPSHAPINYLPLPTIPLPRATVADFPGAPHRYPRTASRPPRRARAPGWERTYAAYDYSIRPSTRGLTFTSAVGMAPPTPPQSPTANNAVATGIDPESEEGKQIILDLVQRMNVQDRYLKNILKGFEAAKSSSKL